MPIPGKKWKPGDPPPVREDFANSIDYENADSEYRRWRQDQKKDASGAITEKAIKQTGTGESDPVHGVRQFKDVTAPTVVEQDTSKLVDASKKQPKKKWNAEKGAFEDEPEVKDNPAEEKAEEGASLGKATKKPKKQSYIDPMTIGAPRGRA